MTLNRLKRRRRRSLYKKLLPTILSVALIFSCVMSMGFAKWQDTLAINATVSVLPDPVTISLSKYDAYSYYTLGGLFDDLNYGQSTDNWVCYLNSYTYFGVVTRDVIAYMIPMSTPTYNAAKTEASVTIYNPELDSSEFPGMSAGTTTDSYGGTYAYVIKNSRYTSAVHSFGSGRHAFDSSNITDSFWEALIGTQYYGFHKTSGVPVLATFSNPNSSSVVLKNFVICDSNGNTVNYGGLNGVTSVTVPANGTARLVIYPDTSIGKSFYVKFSDGDSGSTGNQYRININISDGNSPLKLSPPNNPSTYMMLSSMSLNSGTTTAAAPTTTTTFTAPVTTTTAANTTTTTANSVTAEMVTTTTIINTTTTTALSPDTTASGTAEPAQSTSATAATTTAEAAVTSAEAATTTAAVTTTATIAATTTTTATTTTAASTAAITTTSTTSTSAAAPSGESQVDAGS